MAESGREEPPGRGKWREGDTVFLRVLSAVAGPWRAGAFLSVAALAALFQAAPAADDAPLDVGDRRQLFLDDIQRVFTRKGRFKAMQLPKGIELAEQITVENDKAQFLGLREYQRTVTTCANAFVQPLMHRYLTKLEKSLRGAGFAGADAGGEAGQAGWAGWVRLAVGRAGSGEAAGGDRRA